MKKLYFVRHGLTDMNVSGHYSGSSNAKLTQVGKQQASQAGKWARDNGIVFDVILTSPLSRAHDTAKLIADEIGYNHNNIVLLDKLRERHFGDLEGIHNSNAPFTREQYLSDPFILDSIENIEKITDLQYRANKVVEQIKSMPHENILIVGHGSFGRAVCRSINNTPLNEYGKSIDNAKIIQLI